MDSFAHGATGARLNPRFRRTAAQPLWLRLLNRFVAWEDRQRQKRRLREMPDYLLKDMGITRRDVDHAFDARLR